MLNTEYCWDQIPVKHFCHKLALRKTEWWAPAWHWQLSCHFRSAGLSLVLFSWFCPHSNGSISGAFVYEISVISSNLSMCCQTFHMPWFWAELCGDFSNSEVVSVVLVHQSQHPNMQLFIIGSSLFWETVFTLTLYSSYTSLVILVFFVCLLSLLGESTLQLPLTR